MASRCFRRLATVPWSPSWMRADRNHRDLHERHDPLADLAKGPAIDDRHHEIEEDHRGPIRESAKQVQGSLPISRPYGSEPLAFQEVLDRCPDVGVIVDHQHQRTFVHGRRIEVRRHKIADNGGIAFSPKEPIKSCGRIRLAWPFRLGSDGRRHPKAGRNHTACSRRSQRRPQIRGQGRSERRTAAPRSRAAVACA